MPGGACYEGAVTGTGANESVRLVELLASLSLATDIGVGSRLENGQRAALLAVALAEAAGLGQDEARDAFYLGLLRTVGCTGDEDLTLRVFGDDAGVWISHAGGAPPAEVVRTVIRNVGRGAPAPRRVVKVLRALGTGAKMAEVSRGHCEVGRLLGQRLGLPPTVVRGLEQVFERWDGRGAPARLKGEAVDRAVRVAQLATEAQAMQPLFGTEQTVAKVRQRAGRGYDPQLAEIFCARGAQLLAVLDVPSTFEALVKSEPGPAAFLRGEALETAIETMGQFSDIRSRYTRGHSGGVAALAAGAAARLGLADVTAVRRAGHLHDIGRAGISLDVWEKKGPLTEGEWERVRMHTYFTERVLARLGSLGPAAAIAALAHERLDGEGYHRRLPPGAVPVAARVLATADAYHAMTEARAHRAALSPSQAAEQLQAAARAGSLDRQIVEAVLAAAGQPLTPGRPLRHATGLTEREIEVLRLLARGLTNKEIATALDISAKTAGHHVQHIFEKAGVTTRAAATLFAMQSDLLAPGP